jgi:hypothetical protein
MENTTYHQKPVDELTFTDDGMFQAVLHNPEICAELIERLLHIKVGHVEYPELEKQIKPFYTTKGVRLDVYLKDENKIIDVEMQSYPQEDLGKRTRYYQSMIDIDSLMKGQDYTELKESYVNLNDKSLKVIYNANAYKQEKDKKIRDFLHFISTNEPGEDDFSNRLSELVETIKDNEIFRSDYAAMNLHDRDIMRAAKKEGALQKAIEDALILIRNYNVTPEQAAKEMNAPLDKLLEALNA